MAEKRGFFADADLDLSVKSPANPASPVPLVANGGAYFGVTQQPQVVLAREEGAPVVGFRTLVSEPTAALIWLRGSGIDGLADLKGKTIAFPGVPFQESLLQNALSRAGLEPDDVTIRRVGYGLVPTLLSGEADAIFGGSWNLEGAALRVRGARPVITKVGALGIPDYEESVVISPFECVYKHPGLTRDFLAAVARGTRAAVEDPGGAARVIGEDVESDPEVGRRGIEAQLRATLPLLSESGLMDPGRGQTLLDWMHKEGLVEEKWSVAIMFTNYYL
jgi:putative hydroxymethylpyrimidine transport system substrate-binding protein